MLVTAWDRRCSDLDHWRDSAQYKKNLQYFDWIWCWQLFWDDSLASFMTYFHDNSDKVWAKVSHYLSTHCHYTTFWKSFKIFCYRNFLQQHQHSMEKYKLYPCLIKNSKHLEQSSCCWFPNHGCLELFI